MPQLQAWETADMTEEAQIYFIASHKLFSIYQIEENYNLLCGFPFAQFNS